ncbi:BQ5605_C001g00196 [Microbotryum silenes-dioicae]|uniref:Ubiquinone biosynthesis O-methyltransferase, mitochondrial n=1 Tax=Microbotryum silenes-dioicae TaxID=796604 RepID=A0A2X0P5I6_9BASI|nr:BQ5605_C001g00196 [Microbotryum silenes-dioicae]
MQRTTTLAKTTISRRVAASSPQLWRSYSCTRALQYSTSSSSTSAPYAAPYSTTSSSNSKTNTISASEVAHFSSLAQHWWDPTGEFKLLHRMNPSRIRFLRDRVQRVQEIDIASGKWLDGFSVLDVGCGGGIFAESLARLGATTTAIDASEINIKTATLHASLDDHLTHRSKLEYRHCAAEDLVQEGKQFDIVCAMEVVEHVEDPRAFLGCLAQLTKVRVKICALAEKETPRIANADPNVALCSLPHSFTSIFSRQPGGHLLLSTISRTPLAHLLTITLAENLLRFVTPGTHTYSKYIKPSELQHFFESDLGWPRGTMERRGCVYDPLKGDWRLFGMGEWGGLAEGITMRASCTILDGFCQGGETSPFLIKHLEHRRRWLSDTGENRTRIPSLRPTSVAVQRSKFTHEVKVLTSLELSGPPDSRRIRKSTL